MIERKAEHENTDFSICFNEDCDSKEIHSREGQSSKHLEQSISTRAGIMIDRKEESKKAADSNRLSDDGDSNDIDSRDLHDAKHLDPRIST
jgi:hypothetical protein